MKFYTSKIWKRKPKDGCRSLTYPAKSLLCTPGGDVDDGSGGWSDEILTA